MIYFSLLISLVAFSQTSTTLSGFENYQKNYEKSIPHDPTKQTIYSQGGESDKNRLTNNEYALNFLKKEILVLKKEVLVLQKRIKLLEMEKTKEKK